MFAPIDASGADADVVPNVLRKAGCCNMLTTGAERLVRANVAALSKQRRRVKKAMSTKKPALYRTEFNIVSID